MFDLDPYYLFFTILFSFIGIAYFSYGKKESQYFRLAGVLLLVFPYFISSLLWTIIIGVILCAAPFLLDMYFPID